MKINLKIEGMHCQSCAVLLKDALQDLGVKNSRIDSKKGTAEIEFDERKISPDNIRKIIEKEGYKAR